MILVLMAAGSGSRYGKLKQFDELGPKGEFLMEFSIYDAIKAGCNQVVVITRKERRDFLHSYLSKYLPSDIRLDVVVQEISDLPNGMEVVEERVKPWGTAHAVWSARNVIKDDFLVINADDFYGKKAFDSASSFIKKRTSSDSFAMVSYKLRDTLSDHGSVSRGVCKTEDGMLMNVKEYTKINEREGVIKDEVTNYVLKESTPVSMNCWVCTPKIFKEIEKDFRSFLLDADKLEKGELYLPFVIAEMMRENKIQVSVLNAGSSWFGVTYYPDKEDAVKELKRLTLSGVYPSPLWKNS